MPANLPPQYTKLEEDYRKATEPKSRLALARELYKLLPKHKGTEKLQANWKRTISELLDESEAPKSGGKKTGASHKVPREGAGQVVIVGPPNSGKSQLLASLTNAKPEVAPYPFTTRAPCPGIARHLDVRFQLVDLPAAAPEMMEPWVAQIVRGADAALLVVDLGDDDLIEATEGAIGALKAGRAELVREWTDLENEDERTQRVPTIVVANKSDVEGAQDRLALLEEWLGGRFPVEAASAALGDRLDSVKTRAYDWLGVMRVFTKPPGRPVDLSDPFALPLGSTVLDLARSIHKGLEATFKSARVWGSGAFDGQTVKRDHELKDGDVVELQA